MDVLDIFSEAAKPRMAEVEINGKTVHVRDLDAIRRAAYISLVAQSMVDKAAVPDHLVVAWGLCNPDGSPSAASVDDRIARLERCEGSALYRAASKILELSGLGPKAVETIEKNSQPAGNAVPVPAGAGSRKDRRAAASRSRRVRR
jgi:hypothetical protein